MSHDLAVYEKLLAERGAVKCPPPAHDTGPLNAVLLGCFSFPGPNPGETTAADLFGFRDSQGVCHVVTWRELLDCVTGVA